MTCCLQNHRTPYESWRRCNLSRETWTWCLTTQNNIKSHPVVVGADGLHERRERSAVVLRRNAMNGGCRARTRVQRIGAYRVEQQRADFAANLRQQAGRYSALTRSLPVSGRGAFKSIRAPGIGIYIVVGCESQLHRKLLSHHQFRLRLRRR